MHKSKVVNTNRERHSPNKKNSTIGALVTGFTSTQTTMADEINPTDILFLNGNHSPLKKLSHENEILDEQNSHVDSGLSSDTTNTELEKTINIDDDLSSISSTLNDSNLHSGVIIPEEKRVTDRVKVFEAVANKNGNKKILSSSFSIADQKQQTSPSSTESFDTQSMNEIKSSSKTKSKKSSLKKQIQNLLKIDKPSIQDDFNAIDEQTNGKKSKNMKQQSAKHSVEPLEIQIPTITKSSLSPTISKLITNDIQQNTPPVQSENLTSSSSPGVSQFDTSIKTNTDLLSTNSPTKSVPSIITHSPMSTGVGDSVKTSTRSVSIESGSRHRSPIRQYGQNETSNISTSSLLNQSTNAQVTDNLRVQHQREKQELSELNDRFRGYLDRVKTLENKNSKLTGQLDDISKTWGATSQAIITQYGTPLDRLRQEVNESMMDEADLQTRLRRSHYNIDNYRSLIHDETVWNDRQESKREQLKLEYEHSCIELSALQKSYKQIEDQLKILIKQREDYLQEIDQLNEQSYKVTLDRINLDLQVQTLREEIPFFNDVHAHLISEFEQLKPTNGMDTQLFYRQELEKAIRDIRRDFETLHSAQRKEMEDYYTVKIEEIQNDAKKLSVQSRPKNSMKISEQIKSTKFELNDTQNLLIHEKDKFKDLQDHLTKLEEEYNYVRNQRNDANDNVNKDLSNAQDRIQQLAGEIDNILQSNITLESEINIYRRLLDSETNRLAQPPIEHILSPEPAPPSFGSELGKVFNKKIKKGPIAIKDCAPDGKCITLENSSMDKDVDVSNWILKRRVEGSPEISYTIPYGLVMKHGSELKIFARGAQNAHHRPPLQVVNDKLDSWGMGTECETKLFNEQGEEKASHSQKIVFGSDSARHLP